MSRNQGNNLFDTTCNDNICAWMQITNYCIYLRGHAWGSCTSNVEMKLRAARQSEDLRI